MALVLMLEQVDRAVSLAPHVEGDELPDVHGEVMEWLHSDLPTSKPLDRDQAELMAALGVRGG